MKTRLDQLMHQRQLVATRSQAENWIRLGRVQVDGQVITKPGHFTNSTSDVQFRASEHYVSRAGLKLASVAKLLNLNFDQAVVLDVGSSTGGFTDYALRHGAKKVIAVDVGTDQLHANLRGDPRIELHEKTDIRSMQQLSALPDIVLIDVSFISLREILPHIAQLGGSQAKVVAMFKPQFEAGDGSKHKGVIKNDTLRRHIVRNFELWVKNLFTIQGKADSDVHGARGNRERFYLLKRI